MKNKWWPYALIGIILISIISITCMIISKDSVKRREAYIINVKIDSVDLENKKSSYSIEIKDDGINSIVNLNYIDTPIYIDTKNKMTYFNRGHYRQIENDNTYRNLYTYLFKIDLGEKHSKNSKEVYYNPKLDVKELNTILDTLNIGIEVKNPTSAYIVLKNNYLREFNLYLNDIDGYESFNIMIAINDLDKSEKIKLPIFYSELIEEGSKEELTVIE